VPDLEPQVPQHIEESLDELLDARRRLVGHEEEDIHVGVRREHAAPITADGDNCRRRPREFRRGEPTGGHFEPYTEQFICVCAQFLRARAAGSARFQDPARFLPSGVQRQAKSFDRRPAEGARIACMPLVEGGKFVEKPSALDAPDRRRTLRAAFHRGSLGF
jgi:hypothetical protein